eukprot:TRINITY_DN11550_c0_g1_i2.p1 TRINITY_DN11550_c0_g1~~TRINITY_DN11550_c0_g1_i2.p1  ORF type:complete len:375 (-),score=120.19 TRINITY_DN11550_c0_g1_i2:69-1193(-)
MASEDADIAICMDGVMFQGQQLKIRRPKDYVAPPGGESTKKWYIPGIISTTVEDGPNKIYIGNLAPTMTELEVQDLVKYFGALKSFNLIKDGNTGISKGYAFFEYVDPAVTDLACQSLNTLEVFGRKITCQRANSLAKATATSSTPTIASSSGAAPAAAAPQTLNLGSVLNLNPSLTLNAAALAAGTPLSMAQPVLQLNPQLNPSLALPLNPALAPGATRPLVTPPLNPLLNPNIAALAASNSASTTPASASAPTPAPAPTGLPVPIGSVSTVLVLSNMITQEELVDDEEYAELVQDIHDECGKHGTITQVNIPRPAADPSVTVPGLTKIFVQYTTSEMAIKAAQALQGRTFGGRAVGITFLSEDKFRAGQLDA